jgi:hypothetical protein
MTAGAALVLDIVGIGAWSAAHRGWPALVAACAGETFVASPATARPAPDLLPPAERRRAPDGVAVALEVASEAVAMARSSSTLAPVIDRTMLASVFTSAHGDLAIVDYLCATLASDPTALSPTRFHLSVHNAAAGHWSIAAADRAPSTALAAGDDSFALGLLEAATMAIAERRAVLLVAFDTPAVGLLAHATQSTALFGFALVLRPGVRRGHDGAVEDEGVGDGIIDDGVIDDGVMDDGVMDDRAADHEGSEHEVSDHEVSDHEDSHHQGSHHEVGEEVIARLTLSITSESVTMPLPVRSALAPLARSSAAARALALAEALAIDGRTEVRYPLGDALGLAVAIERNITHDNRTCGQTIE